MIDKEKIHELANLARINMTEEEEKELTEEAAILTPHFQKDADMETLVMDHYLINHPKVLITPHNAFNSVEALARIENTTIENIKAFLEGKDINLVTSHS